MIACWKYFQQLAIKVTKHSEVAVRRLTNHQSKGGVSSCRKRFKRKVRQREGAHRRRGGKRTWKLAKSIFHSSVIDRIFAPKIFNITKSEQRDRLIIFLSKLRNAVIIDGHSVLLDFSRTTNLEASGTLIFAAELDRCLRMKRVDQNITIKLPKSGQGEDFDVVRQALHQIGILEKLGYDCASFDPDSYPESVRHWRFATGTKADEKPGDILDEYEGKISPALMDNMQIGLAEAVINSIHHAYRGNRGDNCRDFKEKRWWMFTQEREGHLHVLVCDLGIGMKRSLPHKWGAGLVKRLLKSMHEGGDVAAIRLALVIGQSATGQSNRGLGLDQIWRATRSSARGSVGIYSGRGLLAYNGEAAREVTQHYHSNILGTMISWKVPIERAENEAIEEQVGQSSDGQAQAGDSVPGSAA